MQIAYLELFESSNSDWTNWPCIILRVIRIRGGVFPQYSKVLVNNHNFIIMETIYNAGRQSQIIEVYHYLFPYFKSEFQTSLTHRHYKHSPINLRNVHEGLKYFHLPQYHHHDTNIHVVYGEGGPTMSIEQMR